MGLFAAPSTVNSRGDVLSDADKKMLGQTQHDMGLALQGKPSNYVNDPKRRMELLTNWLTAGGAPKPIEAGVAFKEKQDTADLDSKAAAGQGINSLFGFGKMIGDLTPAVDPVAPVGTAIKPIKMIEPMNQSPMQTGVPYSALPLPGGK